MTTVFTSLTFYDSLAKQDRTRTGAIIPVHCPRTQLPPFLISVGTATVATIDSIKLVSCEGTETTITGYFSVLPTVTASTATSGLGTYVKYNGAVMSTLMPTGSYYVKITKSDAIYYSDWIKIMNIYENLITGLTNFNYETFTKSGTVINSAINTSGNGEAYSSNAFSIIKGHTYKLIFFATLNGGATVLPNIYLLTTVAVSNIVTVVAGLNEITFTATASSDAAYLYFINDENTNFSTTQMVLVKTFSSKFIRIDFTNSINLGNIRYEDTFTQTVWLEAILNSPTHEMVNVGEEKDGIFIAEKIVSKFLYSVICYVSRGLYNCLMRLPQHGTITITDEVGNAYSPEVGNIIVEPPEWVSFETCRLLIKFNDGANSAYTWTK